MARAPVFREKLPERVAVLRAVGGLGDFLCVVPALRSLRAALPQATLTLIGLPAVKPLVQRFSHYIDELVEFPGFPGLPEQSSQLEEFPAFLEAMHQRQFDLAIQMHGSGIITNPLTMLLNASVTAGFYLPNQYCPDRQTFLPYQPEESEVRRYLRLLEFLGFPTRGEALEFTVQAEDWQALRQIPGVQSLFQRDFVCLHPGASLATKRWSVQQFAQVGDSLAGWGLPVVLTGNAAERELTQAVAIAMQAPSYNLAGCTSLPTLAALLLRSRLLVCNDTGVSHLAAALQVPSVVLFSNSDPQRWAPLDRQRHRVVETANSTLVTVLTQASELLQRGGVYAAS